MKKKLALGVGLIVVAVTAVAAVAAVRIGPSNIIGMMRYDQREEGRLKVGDLAPDVELLSLDASPPARLSAQIGERPLVLVFGSFT